jgi:integrase/recombinase XerD
MFDKICKSSRAIERHLTSPLVDQRLSYLNYCASRGSSIRTLRNEANYLLAIIDCLDLKTEGFVSPSDIEAAANHWITRPGQYHNRKDSSATKREFITVAKHWLNFLGRLTRLPIEPCPEAGLLEEFVLHLKNERGLSPVTIKRRHLVIEKFLRQACVHHRRLSDLTCSDIHQAISRKTSQSHSIRSTVQVYASDLRTFFRYAEIRGWCAPGLASTIASPRIYRGENLPAGPSWTDVRRLLASTEGDGRAEVRARAILLLLAVYGLRVSEVRRLKLEDIDWHNELLIINRSKQHRRTQTYPLSRTVGEAILRYLKDIRPQCPYREVFISLKAPIRPISRGVIGWLVADRLRALGLPLKHHGPHALRHACATHLLAEGVTLKEIGDHLGHRSSEATSHYAKVDISSLREVADFNLGGLI